MTTGKDNPPARRGAASKKNANCSFCGKSYRDVGPLVEGTGKDLVEALPRDRQGTAELGLGLSGLVSDE